MNNQSAFPVIEDYGHGEYDEHHLDCSDKGMTLHDWFAGQALEGLLACLSTGTNTQREKMAEMFAKASYSYSDAMMEERNQRRRLSDDC